MVMEYNLRPIRKISVRFTSFSLKQAKAGESAQNLTHYHGCENLPGR